MLREDWLAYLRGKAFTVSRFFGLHKIISELIITVSVCVCVCVCVCVLSLYVEDPKVGVGAVIWAEGKQVSQKHIKLDWVYKRILNKEHISDFLLKLPLVTMWWHWSALPCGLWVQRLPSGLAVRRVSSDGSQARGETEQEVQIHAPCGAERAHIQVTRGNEQSRQKNNNSSSAHAGDVLGLNALTVFAKNSEYQAIRMFKSIHTD